MADVSVLKFQGASQANQGYEVWLASIGALETECDITPTYLKSIENVSIMPANAAAAATLIGYVKAGFVPGDDTITIVGDNSCDYLVLLEGKIS